MGYERKKKDVQAIRLVMPVFDQRGRSIADKGDWLVVDGRDQIYMTDEEFHDEFQKKIDVSLPPIIIQRDYPPYRPPYYPTPYWHYDERPFWETGRTICDSDNKWYNDVYFSSDTASATDNQLSIGYNTDSTSNCVYEAKV